MHRKQIFFDAALGVNHGGKIERENREEEGETRREKEVGRWGNGWMQWGTGFLLTVDTSYKMVSFMSIIKKRFKHKFV